MNDIPCREAFRSAQLAEAITAAERAVERARVALHAARGRERAAVRKALSRAQAALTKLIGEQKADTIGEQFAPAVQRMSIVQETTLLREPRVVTHGKSPALVTALARLKSRGSITQRQYDGGRRYRDAYERAGMDAYPIGLGDGAGGGSAPSSGNRRVEEAVGSSIELSRLRQLLGGYGQRLIEHVVIYDLDVSSWAAQYKMDRKGAMGQLEMLLDRLSGHDRHPEEDVIV